MSNPKQLFYFPIAHYFRFFAWIKIKRWHPRVVVITGSSGKTTLLNLIESQLKQNAKYSHHANSAYGVPFNILGLERRSLKIVEWFGLFLKAPFKAFGKLPEEEIYIVEADCDRPGEGKFLSSLLNPEVTLWVSTGRTHTMNFDILIERNKFPNVEEAVAFEYGYFLEKPKLVLINGDSTLMKAQLNRTKATVVEIYKKDLIAYDVSPQGTQFRFDNKIIRLKALLPPAAYFSLKMTIELLKYLNFELKSFEYFLPPPGRSSIFHGLKGTTLIDSSYNNNLSSMKAAVELFSSFPADHKWAVLGDMLELGKEEKEEHEKLAEIILTMDLERLVLMGPRIIKYTYPILRAKAPDNLPIATFETPTLTLDYLQTELQGGETILFKGARFLEGVIANLLQDKNDTRLLARREKIWEKRRKKWGL